MKITLHVDGHDPIHVYVDDAEDGGTGFQLEVDDVPIAGGQIDGGVFSTFGHWPDGENWEQIDLPTTASWEEDPAPTYTALHVMIGDLKVSYCLDDEGPIAPAFFWDIEKDGVRIDSGWEGSTSRARTEALAAARRIRDEKED